MVALAATGCTLDAKEAHAAQTFPFTGTTLTIRSSLGGLRVLPGAAGRIEVDRWTRGKASDGPTWSLRDGTLRLGANCTVVFGDCGARYHLKVPPGVRLSVDGDDGVILDGLAQDVDVSTRGRIQVQGATGRLRLLSDDGPITGDGLKSAYVRGRSSSGAIDLAFTSPPSELDLLSQDGGVTVRVPKADYAVKATSAEGSERSEFRNAKGSDRSITARSMSGNVRVLAR